MKCSLEIWPTGIELHVGHGARSSQFHKVVRHLLREDGATTASNRRRCFHTKFPIMIEIDHGVVWVRKFRCWSLSHVFHVSARVSSFCAAFKSRKYHLSCLKHGCVRMPSLKSIANA